MITFNLISLLASLSCLTPFLSLHLTQRIGLLLFESDVLLFRSSLFSALAILIFLIITIGLLVFISRRQLFKTSHLNESQYERNFQKFIRFFLIILSSLSAIFYLALPLIVPQIKQIQRMPIATFDCNANLITIENCHQQFTTRLGEQTLKEAIDELLIKKFPINGNRDRDSSNNDNSNENNDLNRLIRKLNCLRYNNKELNRLQVPTRFLLHKCSLVCQPQQQQLHQFGDDLNKEQQSSSNRIDLEDSSGVANTHHIYYNRSTASRELSQTDSGGGGTSGGQVSLKVCFSGEFNGASNSYKQFCITNLSSNKQDQALTVGQLNAMLRKYSSDESAQSESHANDMLTSPLSGLQNPERVDSEVQPETERDDRTTHYVNPIVQFESHFKNWPHLSSRPSSGQFDLNQQQDADMQNSAWCKFKPMPPFIVNNKPFSDIQCSLEHEYTMTTGPSLESNSLNPNLRAEGNIYLKKSSDNENGNGEATFRERCNIQCKVNILYQIIESSSQVKGGSNRQPHKQTFKAPSHLEIENPFASVEEFDLNDAGNQQHYYLPLKPCVIITDDGDKPRTFSYYLIFRTLADTSSLLIFILLDMLILFESIDRKQSLFEGKRFRLFSLLIILALMPLIVSLIFDLTNLYFPYQITGQIRKDGFLMTYLNDHLIPSIMDLFSKTKLSPSKQQATSNKQSPDVGASQTTPIVLDNHMIPFFFYAICMFTLTINSLSLPTSIKSSSRPSSPDPERPTTGALIKASSTEELGLAGLKTGLKASKESVAIDISDESAIKAELDKQRRRQITKMLLFLVITLFMGLQFNLSQLNQTQIFTETFGNPSLNNLNNQFTNYKAVIYTFYTNSSAIILVLLITILLINETSVYFQDYFSSPFKSSAQEYKPNQSRFLKFQCISLAIYSMRFYALSSLNFDSQLKWLVVFLFQLGEIFNFPLTWLSLTNRVHEILIENPNYQGKRQNYLDKSMKFDRSSLLNRAKALELHILFQLIIAFVYFVLAKPLALFVHTLHASLHLHSDNVNWFIKSFYKPQATRSVNANSTKPTIEPLFSPLPGERQTYLHGSRLFLKYNSLICFLVCLTMLLAFAYIKYQLWVERRQTLDVFHPSSLKRSEKRKPVPSIIDARRKLKSPVQFLKKRLPNLNELATKIKQVDSSSSATTFDPIDELLSRDLKTLKVAHRASDRQKTFQQIRPVHYFQDSTGSPTISYDTTTASSTNRAQSPKAKILFHYDLGRKRAVNSSSSSSDELPVEVDRQRGGRETGRAFRGEQTQSPLSETITTPEFDQNQIDDSIEIMENGVEMNPSEDEAPIKEQTAPKIDTGEKANDVFEEKIIRQKRVRIFEDDENWDYRPQEGDKVDHCEDDYEINIERDRTRSNNDDPSNRQPQRPSSRGKRSITFAPTPTLIENSKRNSRLRVKRNEASDSDDDDSRNNNMDNSTNPKSQQTTVTRIIPIQRASPEPSIDEDDDSD